MNKADFYFWFGLLFVSIWLGGVVVSVFASTYRICHNIKRPTQGRPKPFPGWITGLLERIFFTILVAGGIQGAGPAIFTWLAAKQLCNLNNRPEEEGANGNAREWHFSALIFSFVNAFFAVIGGLFATHWQRAERLMPFMSSIGEWGSDHPIYMFFMAYPLLIVITVFVTLLSGFCYRNYIGRTGA